MPIPFAWSKECGWITGGPDKTKESPKQISKDAEVLAPADVLAAKIIEEMERERNNRDWLAEAYAIARGHSARLPEVEHLQAAVMHCRELERLLMFAAELLKKEGE